jgi:D-aspartate ligase
MRKQSDAAVACVLGGMDLIRPLGLAGIRCVAVAARREPARYSRFVDSVLDRPPAGAPPGALVERLVEFGARQRVRPVLYFVSDADLLVISRFRDVLADFHLALPDAELVEDLADKARFDRLAARLRLPVPRSAQIRLGEDRHPRAPDLRFPLIVKPSVHLDNVDWAGSGAKAVEVSSPQALADWARAVRPGVFVAQELVPGPESAIESYHAYVDRSGEIVAEFTGRKLRTFPPQYGFSTALTLTDDPDVALLGRDIVGRVELRGVMKIDFKRAPSGELFLLEINARFNLWHHLGAVAGVNLPAIVFDDLTSGRRAPRGAARSGARWCSIRDLRAARAEGESVARWLRWAWQSDAVSGAAWDDPLPLVRGEIVPQVTSALLRAGRSSRGQSGHDRIDEAAEPTV